MAEANNKVDVVISADASEFKQGMKDARDAAKGFATEEKLVDAEMKANGVTIEGLIKKQKALNGQVDAQKAKIKLLTAEYKKVCEEQGENSEAAQALATDIRKENVQLQNLQAKAQQANVALLLLKKGAKLCASAVSAVWDGCVAAWQTGLQIATDAAQKWDDVATAAKQAQTSTEEYQGLEYASNFLDFDMDAYYKAKNRLQTATQETIANAFADAGIEFDWDGVDFGDKAGLFNAVLAQLGGASSEQQAAIEKALFGDELGVKMRTLYGDEAVQQLQQLQAEAERLGIVTAEAGKVSLQSLNDAHDKWNSVKDGLFMNLGAVFADNFAEMFDGMAEYAGVFSKGLQIFKDAGGGDAGKKAMQDYLDGALTEVDENGDTVGTKLVDGLIGTIENFSIAADIAGVLIDAVATELTENQLLQTALESLGESLGVLWSGSDGESGLYGLLKDIVTFITETLWPLIEPLLKKLRAALLEIGTAVGNEIMDVIDPMGVFHTNKETREVLEAADKAIGESQTGSDEFAQAQAAALAAIEAWENRNNGGGGRTTGAGGGRNSGTTSTAPQVSPETQALLDESAAILARANEVMGRGGADNYTETDNSTHEQNVTIYVSGASSPAATGNKIATLLSEYYERNERARNGGAKGNTRAHIVYE